MNVPLWVWIATVVAIIGLFAIDLVLVDRRPHEIGVAEAARWVVFYIAVAVVFGAGIGVFSTGLRAKQFFAGYVTEYSLSVDNLFVFIVIIAAFRVPKIHEHKVVLVGVLGSLVLRGALIAAGAAVVSRFEWVFYIFGAFLIVTAARLAAQRDDEDEYHELGVLRVLRRVLPVTEHYHGGASFVRLKGKRYVTPLFVVMAALAVTNVLFAFDSIPAIFGLTKNAFIVFTANAFALMGLRQLYFMVGGLLTRLVYLSRGLAVVLGFIGVKLIMEALVSSGVPGVPEISIEVSLGVIVAVLAITTVASLLKTRHDGADSDQKPDPAKHREPKASAQIVGQEQDRAAEKDRELDKDRTRRDIAIHQPHPER
ncbi:MAG TPA: TerC family protein [Mycobacteriales bacterium]|nr:TerC family protein [Mycobacteriales bacterium]